MVIVDTETLPLRNELYRESNAHFENQRLQQLINQHPVKQHVIDVTHNVSNHTPLNRILAYWECGEYKTRELTGMESMLDRSRDKGSDKRAA